MSEAASPHHSESVPRHPNGNSFALGPRVQSSATSVGIQEVANAACVSVGTVSRVANNAASVNQKMRRRVLAAMSELNYKANAQAVALVRGQSSLLGLVVSDPFRFFAAELIDHFQTLAQATGQETMVCFYADDPTECARRLRQRRVEGAAIAMSQTPSLLLTQLAHFAVPTVVLKTTNAAVTDSKVSIDYYPGMFHAVRYLAALGHRRIGFVPGDLTQEFGQAQLHAFMRSCQTLSIDLRRTEQLPPTDTLAGGQNIIVSLFERKEPPTAICCSNALASHGILQAISNNPGLLRRGMSLIACEDAPSLALTAPAISAIGVDSNRLAEALLVELLKLGKPQISEKAGAILQTRLLVRSTTRPPL